MKNNFNQSFKSILSLAVVFAIFTGILTGGVAFGNSSLSAENGIESLINEAQELFLNDRDQFVDNLNQDELDELREGAKDLTQNQKNSLLDKLNRNDNFDVVMRNILLADKGKQLILEDVIYKLENREKSKLEKFIKEAILLTSVAEKSKTTIEFLRGELYKVNEDTYLDYVDEANDIFLGMSRDDIEEALQEFSEFTQAQKDGIITVIMILNQENFDIEITGFESIAYDINDMVMYCGYDNLGTKILLRMFIYFSNIGGTGIVRDQDDNVYDVKLAVQLPKDIEDMIDRALEMTGLMGRDVTTFGQFLQEIEELINEHSETEIYNFKDFLNNEFDGVYSGDLPVPETDSNDRPVSPPSSGQPSDDDDNDDDDDEEDVSDTPPSSTPKPDSKEVEESKDGLPSTVTFIDVEDHWAVEHITKLAKLGIVSGYTDGSIKPNNNITRAEMAVIAVNAASLEPSKEINLNFEDVDQIPDWAAGHIQTAVDNEIISGYEDNTFRPSRKLTREEMVVLVLRAFDIEAEEGLEPLTFIDVDQIGSWSLEYVTKSVDLDIVSGYSDNSFKPKRNVTRAETFTVLHKTLKD
ncbi:S-layer homology domain-containing protein [Herbivorax sp. ANBcel31]|uniref:S-layer homology domain-containing protein n=1 Tax=Herbivorax sp. ANBcel31 TaxID=3069754 RepID=UPI0027B207AE|nr:S-layer homology domain-containing protein [Herbivorax sp. ANBcel31]MDQ2088094.1 S-layer homology domain-containing protein [Herbivorax sp. ANBcel31]